MSVVFNYLVLYLVRSIYLHCLFLHYMHKLQYSNYHCILILKKLNNTTNLNIYIYVINCHIIYFICRLSSILTSLAVDSVICIRPFAFLDEVACLSKPLSALITANTKYGSSLFFNILHLVFIFNG